MRSRRSAAVVVTITALVLAGAVAYALETGRAPAAAPSPLIGSAVPAASMLLLDGTGAVSPAELGGNIVVVHFWSPDCAACPGERAALLAVADAYREFDVTVIAALVYGSPAAGRTFLGENGRSPLVADAFDPEANAALAYGVGPVPVTYLVDRAGTLTGRITGAAGFDLLAASIDAVIVGVPPQSSALTFAATNGS
jgi:cytochrome c biogenesis protein CcmG/thiol:disulfide interchange protein DsbE